MADFRGEFLEALDREDRAACVEMALHRLEMGHIDVLSLYREVLAPALNDWQCKDADADICVWREHVRTSIVRTVVEVAYPYVVKEAARRKGMRTLREDGWLKVQQGITTVSEVLRVTQEEEII